MSDQIQRLHAIVESGNVIEFFSAPDNEYPGICWTVFGSIDTNEVIVRASVADRSFYHSSPSPLVFPTMADRRFGIDVADQQLASHLSTELWQQHGDLLARLAGAQEPGGS